jgi:hypothetical protein
LQGYGCPAAGRAARRLVGGRTSTTVCAQLRRSRSSARAVAASRTPCRTARTVRLALTLPTGATRVRVTVQRLRAGHWRGLRVLTLRPIEGKVRVRLPVGRLRLETSPAHDSLPHAWVAYLIVH